MYDLFLFGLFLLALAGGYAIFIPCLYVVYKLTGGKRSFLNWYRAKRSEL